MDPEAPILLLLLLGKMLMMLMLMMLMMWRRRGGAEGQIAGEKQEEEFGRSKGMRRSGWR